MYEAWACSYYKFDLANGATLWHHGSSCGGGGTVPQLLGNQLFVREASPHQSNSILDADTGATLGTFPPLDLNNMVPALYDNGAGKHFMVVPSGASVANYDVTNPASIFSTWSTNLNNEQVSSAPLVVNGYTIAGTFAGGLYVISPQGEIVWSARVGKSVAPTTEHNGTQPMSALGAGDGIVVVPTQDDNANSQTLFVFGQVGR